MSQAPSRKPYVRVDQDEYLLVLAEMDTGSAALPDLAEYFDVSEGTARRKLDGLAVQGKVLALPGNPRCYRLVLVLA